ncbi:MAG: hypothetical protein AAF281_05860, partial [Pseudomonadota bacterium]
MTDSPRVDPKTASKPAPGAKEGKAGQKTVRHDEDEPAIVQDLETSDPNSMAAVSGSIAGLVGLLGPEAEAFQGLSPRDMEAGSDAGSATLSSAVAVDVATDAATLTEVAASQGTAGATTPAEDVSLGVLPDAEGTATAAPFSARNTPAPAAPEREDNAMEWGVEDPVAADATASSRSAPKASAPASGGTAEDTPSADSDPQAAPTLTVTPQNPGEGAAGGTVVATLDSTLPDTQFAFVDADGAPYQHPLFEIVGDKVHLRDGATLDYETAPLFELTVVGTTPGAETATAPLRLDIQDAAEHIRLADGGAQFTETGVTEAAVTGGAGADTLTGAGGDDVFAGRAGDDSLSGGAGQDTAVWDGNLADFTVRYSATDDSFTIVDRNGADGLDEGRDTVSGVETFVFNGQSYSAADLQAVAARQANSAPDSIVVTAGGTIDETVTDGGDLTAAHDAGGTVAAKLETRDADAGDTHSYTLVADASGMFEIQGDEIRVKAGAVIDFETDTQFDVTVRSTDEFGATVDQTITLHVADFEGQATLGNSGGSVQGSSEEDRLTGGTGDDTLLGGAGDDHLTGGGGADWIDGGAGSDTVVLGGGTATVVDTGTDGMDRVMLDGSSETYTLQSDFSAAAGIETVDGSGQSGETLSFGPGPASVDLSGVAMVGIDEIALSTADDVFVGSASADRVVGDAGDDMLSGGTAAETGTDTAVFAGAVDDYTLTLLADGTLRVSDSVPGRDGTDTLTNFEVLEFDGVAYKLAEGTDGADNLTPQLVPAGPDSGVLQVAGGGNDQLQGGAGNDALYAGAGDDTLFGSAGGDRLDGGSGSDTVRYDNDPAAPGVTVNLATGQASGGQAEGDRLFDIENVVGTDQGDGLTGDAGDNSLSGQAGDDALAGGGGQDTLLGGAGADTLQGGAGDDALDGGAGADRAVWAGDLRDFAVHYDAAADTFTLTDRNAADGDEGRDTVTGVEVFSFNGQDYTAADLQAEAARQANEAPTAIT